MKRETVLHHVTAQAPETKRDGIQRLIGLLGDPVAHTLSPAMQNAALTARDVNCRYIAFRVAAENFETAMEGLAALEAVGTNVTVPHKERAFRWVRHLDPSAARTGAVNTVLFGENGAIGYNTDVSGIRTALSSLSPRRNSVLVLGAGGAARAVVCALQDEGFDHIALSNRTRDRAEKLRKELFIANCEARTPACEIVSWGEAPSFAPDLLVNATSLGLHDSPWPDELLENIVSHAKKGAVLDLVYARGRETALCERAKRSGIPALSGQEVLLHQGTAAFKLFTGMTAPVEIMREALRNGKS